jgi:Ca-activated chloride channel homolog
MKWQYEEWNHWIESAMEALSDLMELFNLLLLKTGGDVDQVLEWMKHLQEQGYISPDIDLEKFREALEEQQLITPEGDGSSLSTRGERWVREKAFKLIFSKMKRGMEGNHPTSQEGAGAERLPETRPYKFGDPVTRIDVYASLQNAVKRSGLGEIQMEEEDLQVYETDHLSASATVLLIDISHSMILYGEDRITPAKQVALALTEFILTRFPKDSLSVAVFGDDAKEIDLQDIPYINVGPFHTNTKAGLQLAQAILRKKKQPNKQIFMITDGKPSAMFEGRRLYKNSWGLDPKIINSTLEEAYLCRQAGIGIVTYMITDDPHLMQFVEQLSEAAKGKAYYSTPDRLGDFIFVDYHRNKRMNNPF